MCGRATLLSDLYNQALEFVKGSLGISLVNTSIAVNALCKERLFLSS